MLALVAAGLTNRQIAEELFISVKTAGIHVSNILAKLAWPAGSRPPPPPTAPAWWTARRPDAGRPSAGSVWSPGSHPRSGDSAPAVALSGDPRLRTLE